MRIFWFLIVIPLGSIAVYSFVYGSQWVGQPLAYGTPTPTPLGKVTSMNAEDRKEIESVSVLKANRPRLSNLAEVRGALDQLEIIAKLRKIESEETMSSVVEYLDVHDNLLDPPKPISARRRDSALFVEEECYPAVRILENIGKRALPILKNTLEFGDASSSKFHNAIHVIKYYFRPDSNGAAAYLREQIDLAKSESGRQNLLIAADRIDKNLP